MIFVTTRMLQTAAIPSDLVTILTEENRMKSNSSFNNNRTQIKVLEILFENKSNNLGKNLNTNLYNQFISSSVKYNYKSLIKCMYISIMKLYLNLCLIMYLYSLQWLLWRAHTRTRKTHRFIHVLQEVVQ